MADTSDSKSDASDGVWVRVPPQVSSKLQLRLEFFMLLIRNMPHTFGNVIIQLIERGGRFEY